MVITVDGLAGAGKSTVSRAVADALGYRYLDTGAMYRAVTLLALEHNVDLEDAQALAALADEATTRTDDPELRSPKVDASVSLVSRHAAVRGALQDAQRAFLSSGDAVAEGRDIGAIVWPQAELKVWLDAPAALRAQRRVADLGDTTAATALHERDRRDAAQSIRAEDAVAVETAGLSVEEVVGQIVALARKS